MFRTRAAREAEEAARTAALGPVRVRLQFPDGTILQAAFKATDPLGQVQVRIMLEGSLFVTLRVACLSHCGCLTACVAVFSTCIMSWV